jgi:hypothetical protein
LSGSKSGTRFFSDKAGDIRNFEAAATPAGPGWAIPALAALFLCHARALHYKLTGGGAGPGGRGKGGMRYAFPRYALVRGAHINFEL